MNNPLIRFFAENDLIRYLHTKEVKIIEKYWRDNSETLSDMFKRNVHYLTNTAHDLFTRVIPERFLSGRSSARTIFMVRDEIFGKAVNQSY